jgi:hypothetical protein
MERHRGLPIPSRAGKTVVTRPSPRKLVPCQEEKRPSRPATRRHCLARRHCCLRNSLLRHIDPEPPTHRQIFGTKKHRDKASFGGKFNRPLKRAEKIGGAGTDNDYGKARSLIFVNQNFPALFVFSG